MDGIHAIGSTFDASYTQTYAALAGAGSADQAMLEGGQAGDSVELAQAYESPNSLSNMLGGAMDDQMLGMMIALMVLEMLLGQDSQQTDGSMEDMLAMLGQAFGAQQSGDGSMMAMQTMTLSFSYESISLGTQTPAFESHGSTDVMA
jgi:hypothetical protein